ncbi:GAF domain-containing protein [Flectobacillus major]|uniref:GAF domain-containing protein n=1 Tax=Flectobacillus major TaxID=103 RepID=UPI00047D9894|nr:GAF domain-containing protein [Flectobacillus major]
MKTITTDIPELEIDHFVQSSLSFRPFVEVLRKKSASLHGVQKKMYQDIIEQFEEHPELLQPFTDPQLLHQYPELIQLLRVALFPMITEDDKQLFALSYPFYFQIFYYSEAFQNSFVDLDTGLLTIQPEDEVEHIKDNKCQFAYKWILEKYYNVFIDAEEEMTYAFQNRKTGLLKYYKVAVDKRFIDIKYLGNDEIPLLKEGLVCRENNVILDLKHLRELLPLDNFSFEGFGLINIKDITQEACLNEMKNIVLKMPTLSENISYQALENTIQVLLGIKDVKVNLFSFLKINDTYVMSEEYNKKSLLITPPKGHTSYKSFAEAGENYAKNPEIIFKSNLLDGSIDKNSMFYTLLERQYKGYIMYPIIGQDRLLGVLEIASENAHELTHEEIQKISTVLPTLQQALDYHVKNFNHTIEQLIKQKFTSLQPSVEWKFNEVAWEYLKDTNKQNQQIGNVIFNNVYPLYGAIDIRNSSIERNHAIQKDFIEQLQIIKTTLTTIRPLYGLPLLDELIFKNNLFIEQIKDGISPEEEININYFFDEEIEPMFRHLLECKGPGLAILEHYFEVSDQNHGHVYRHRRAFEESLNMINSTVSNYLEIEKDKLQESYPNYFEKYKTDGVEYNIYLGQSIAPHKPFNQIYLRNLRLWQLLSMAELMKLTHDLVPTLPVKLHTTQLILIHSNPIDISFRKDERRFDTEGAYNLRYEIMKKRIDKALIKNTGERLTQPNKIALVYANTKDAEEYLGYIQYLQNKKLLADEIEYLELEEMQGVYGLKAIRVSV